MEAFAKLLTAIAALVGAIAWPLAIFVLLCMFRNELKEILSKIPVLLGRVKKATLAGINVELDQVAAEAEKAGNGVGNITPQQIRAAARIEVQSRQIDSGALLNELDQLCAEYDSLRRSLPSGTERTRAMTRVIAKMRSLAPSVIDSIESYKNSESAGKRLAAVAMMQMVPDQADLDWLKNRFSLEHAFVFYQAALALQNLANIRGSDQQKTRLRNIAQQALSAVRNFPGTPDRNTISVLETLLSSLPS